MLLGAEPAQRHAVARLDCGQRALLFGGLVLPLLVERSKARERLFRAAEAERGALPARQLHRQRLIHRRGHLRGEGAVVDQFIEPVLVAGERGLDQLGGIAGVGGADGLVRVLRVLAALVDVGLGGQVLGRIILGDVLARGGQRLVGQAGGVGTDVGDQTHGALALDVHALVEHLRDLHGLFRGEGQLAHGLLLQVRGGKGRRRVLFALASLDGGDGVALAAQRGNGVICLPLRGDVVLFVAGADVFCVEFLRAVGELTGDGPVFLRHECVDLGLAVHDHARGHGLHAAGGQTLAHLGPQQRADLVAHEAVEHAARLLGVHQLQVDGARLFHRGLDGLRGDLVELHAAVGGGIDLENVGKVPGDGLALAVRVGCENDLGRAARLLADAVEDLPSAADGDVARLEIVLHVHADLALGQIAHMAVAGFHFVAPAQELADGLGLRGRLHDDQFIFAGGSCHFPITPEIVMLMQSALHRVNATCRLVYYSLQFQPCQERI